MDVPEPLADLMEISSQVEAAVVLDDSGEPVASTLADEERAQALARAAHELLATAERVRSADTAGLTQLDAATRAGSVFVVRDDGGRTIAATTTPSPTVGLVFYDLKTCLRGLATGDEPAPKPRRGRKRKEAGDAAA